MSPGPCWNRAVTGTSRFADRTQETAGHVHPEDYIDWLEGFPFEVAAPDRVLRVLARSGFGERADCKLPGGMNEPGRTPKPGPVPAEPAPAKGPGRSRQVQSHAPTRVGRDRPPPGHAPDDSDPGGRDRTASSSAANFDGFQYVGVVFGAHYKK